MRPPVSYAVSGDVHVAYTSFGEGEHDLVVAPGFVSHLEIMWENPHLNRFAQRLSRFARVITFDKRGTGMSDPVAAVPTLEQRMDDIRAVMDAAGSERAFVMGVSEGAPLCILFAATHPERTNGLILFGGMARATWAPDYPWATPKEALLEAATELTRPGWGTGENVEIFAPSLAREPATVDWWGRVERLAATPGMMGQLFSMFLDIDVRDVLPSVRTPALVMHRRGDRVVSVQAGRWLAEQLANARFVELPGRDHIPWAGDTEAVSGEIEEFITGTRSAPAESFERVLATVLFVDIVDSTKRAAEIGDERWSDLREQCFAAIRAELARFRGREVKTLGDGLLATFDGPARAIFAAQSMLAGAQRLGLELRAGLHTGECEMAGDDVGGIAVHIGARVASLAGPQEVLVSSTVKDLVAGSGIAFVERGAQELKGVPGEWRLYAAA
jgi:pimeloyl-ACP methyl ester carboxylesterase